MKKFYKVYEILDNTEEIMDTYPTYFVGAFLDKEEAEILRIMIDITDCNSSEIKHDFITENDVKDLKNFGLKSCDDTAKEEILKYLKPKDKEIER